MPTLDCFKAYDVRGRLGQTLDEGIACRIGRALARVNGPGAYVVGRDCRIGGVELQMALVEGLRAEGCAVIDIGLAGTEEVYFATSHFAAAGGVELTASHNPAGDNGMKFVGRDSRPLSGDAFARLRAEASVPQAPCGPARAGLRTEDPRPAYARKIAGFADTAAETPVRMVVNAGHGVAGPAFDAIAAELAAAGHRLDITRLHHSPDGRFPAGVPNPLLPENRGATAAAVVDRGADIGIAWDGDFDRCFLFDETGAFIPGEYVVALIASALLARHPGEVVIHDPRVVGAIRHAVERAGGRAVQARTGHGPIKQAMRDHGAIYGGEMSGHHYFRDFMSCDSGMIPCVLVLGMMARSGQPLSALVRGVRAVAVSSGERNYGLANPAGAIAAVRAALAGGADTVEETDGLSLAFPDWRMNLRASATEPLLRLNIEVPGSDAAEDRIARHVARVEALIGA